MWTSQWWNLLLENRTLYSVSPVCLWWTISLQSPTGSILFVIILWHPDTTQIWPRGVINKRQSPQVWTTGLNSPRSDFCRRIGQTETLVSPKFVQWSSFTWQHCKNRSLWGEICIVFLVHGDNANKLWPRKSLFWQESSVNWHIHTNHIFPYLLGTGTSQCTKTKFFLSSIVQFSSVAQLCPTLCNPTDCSMPGLPVHRQLPEIAQTHVHQERSHPTTSSSVIPSSSHLQSFPASWSLPVSRFSHQVAKVLEFQLQHQSFQWIYRTDFLWDWLVASPCSPRDSQKSPTPQFKSINSSALRFFYSPTLTSIHDYWKNHSFD